MFSPEQGQPCKRAAMHKGSCACKVHLDAVAGSMQLQPAGLKNGSAAPRATTHMNGQPAWAMAVLTQHFVSATFSPAAAFAQAFKLQALNCLFQTKKKCGGLGERQSLE